MTPSLRSLVGRAYLTISRYRVVGTENLDPKRPAIIVGAPHTSNWDFVFAVAILWRAGVQPKVLMKKSMTDGPLGPLVRLGGALPVDRERPGRIVEELARMAKGRKGFGLVIAPEGTRSRVEWWKTGFYRIALASGLPVIPVSIDSPTATVRIGEARQMTGDARADMDRLRKFFDGAQGVRVGRGAPVRLRDESQDFRPDAS